MSNNSTINELDNDTVRLLSSSQVVTSVSNTVKELIENSIDADASSIDIKLEDYGLSLVEVHDNGRGIPATHLQYIAKGHHTTKITTFSDLDTLHTYGFRGEALGSLCALCDLSITTRTQGDDHAVSVSFNKVGEIIARKPSHHTRGTTISAHRLFHALPVRKQFYSSLKRKKEELKSVEDCVTSYAIICPGVRFHLTNDRVTVYQKLPLPNTRAVLLSVLSTGPFSQLEAVDLTVDSDIGEIQLHSYLPRPQSKVALTGRATNDRGFVYVNNRPVNMKAINKLIKGHYCANHNCDRWPVFYLSIIISPAAIDANVVPNKTQVMFREQDAVLNAVTKLLTDHYNKPQPQTETDNTGKNPPNIEVDENCDVSMFTLNIDSQLTQTQCKNSESIVNSETVDHNFTLSSALSDSITGTSECVTPDSSFISDNVTLTNVTSQNDTLHHNNCTLSNATAYSNTSDSVTSNDNVRTFNDTQNLNTNKQSTSQDMRCLGKTHSLNNVVGSDHNDMVTTSSSNRTSSINNDDNTRSTSNNYHNYGDSQKVNSTVAINQHTNNIHNPNDNISSSVFGNYMDDSLEIIETPSSGKHFSHNAENEDSETRNIISANLECKDTQGCSNHNDIFDGRMAITSSDITNNDSSNINHEVGNHSVCINEKGTDVENLNSCAYTSIRDSTHNNVNEIQDVSTTVIDCEMYGIRNQTCGVAMEEIRGNCTDVVHSDSDKRNESTVNLLEGNVTNLHDGLSHKQCGSTMDQVGETESTVRDNSLSEQLPENVTNIDDLLTDNSKVCQTKNTELFTQQNQLNNDISFDDLFTEFDDDCLLVGDSKSAHTTSESSTNENVPGDRIDQSEGRDWSRGVSVRDDAGTVIEPVTLLTTDTSKRPRSHQTLDDTDDLPATKRLSLEYPSLKRVSNTKKVTKVPRSAFVHFSSEYRPQVIRDHPGIELCDLDRLVKEAWAGLGAGERGVYEGRAAHDVTRYRKSSGSSMKASNMKNVSLPEALKMMMTQKQISSHTHLTRKSETIELCMDRVSRDYLSGDLTQSQHTDSTPYMIGHIDDCWVFHRDGVISLVNPRRLQETLVYTRLLAHHRIEAHTLETPVLLDAGNIGSKCMETLHSMMHRGGGVCDTISDTRISYNGFTIKLCSAKDQSTSYILTHMNQSIPGYNIHDLQIILGILAQETVQDTALCDCRTPSLIQYFQGEASRTVSTSDHSLSQSEEDLLQQMYDDLAPGTRFCFHNKLFVTKLHDIGECNTQGITQSAVERILL